MARAYGSVAAAAAAASSSTKQAAAAKSSATTTTTTAMSSATTTTAADPAALLARGYTARYLGAVLLQRRQQHHHQHGKHHHHHHHKQQQQQQHGGGNSNIPMIAALSQEEIDRDLRHICAYQEAATRYHQLTYAATNRLPIPPNDAAGNTAANHLSSTTTTTTSADGGTTTTTTTAATGAGAGMTGGTGTSTTLLSSSSPYAVLPVRIDPEEEKRAAAQAKRIQRAEAVREELEQHYVALRAHYVVTTQELQQAQHDCERTTEFLQSSVGGISSLTLGWQRARLQMARDVVAALKLRTAILVEAEHHRAAAAVAAAAVEGPPSSSATPPPHQTATATIMATTNNNNNNADPSMYASGAESCPMLAAWLAVEDECKKQFAALNKGNSSKSKTKQNTLAWSCTMRSATAPGIPLLMSAVSTAPDKSIAVGVSGVFASHSTSLMWLESHLPDAVDEDGEDLLLSEASGVKALRDEVAYLQNELLKERDANQALLVTTGKARVQHDEWVAMISLVRQETEAVLHRHNILLESDEVCDAAAAAAAAAVAQQQAELENDDHKNDDEDAAAEDEERDDTVLRVVGPPLDEDAAAAVAPSEGVLPRQQQQQQLKPLPDEEGANEADDEGMVEEGEEVDDWDTNNNKRSAADNNNDDSEESPGGSRKRRKV